MKFYSLLFCVVLFMSAKGCKDYEVAGNKVAIIYPDQDVARVRVYETTCPLKTSAPSTMNIKELQGWCAVPPDVCAKYARDFEEYVCK